MQIILSDYNCEGQAKLIVETLKDDPGISWVPLELRLFRDVGLRAMQAWRLMQTTKLCGGSAKSTATYC